MCQNQYMIYPTKNTYNFSYVSKLDQLILTIMPILLYWYMNCKVIRKAYICTLLSCTIYYYRLKVAAYQAVMIYLINKIMA